MSLFVPSNCQLVGDTIVNQMSWSQSDQIAALSTYTIDESDREINQVLFANNEGEMVSKSSISHDYEATAFEWHPLEKILTIGWGDGMISCWVVDGENRPSCSYTNNKQHSASISTLKWNAQGKRLVTGDKKGVVCVWAMDARGGGGRSLSPIRQYKSKGEITNMIFCTLPIKSSLDGGIAVVPARKGDPKETIQSPLLISSSFFFGTDRGAIVYADDLGHCSDVQQLSSSIDSMMYFEERSRLVIITRSLLLTQYHVADDGRVTRIMQVKLSVPSDVADRGIRSAVWAGPGLLAIATEEKVIRCLDLATDESYNISLNSAMDDISRSERVTCVAFNPVDRQLAVGTQLGLVAIWKFTGQSRDVSVGRTAVPASDVADWEFVFKTSLGACINQLSWHGGKGTLAVVTEDGAVILNESVIHSSMCGELYLLQTSSQEMAVMSAGSMQPVTINAGMQIRGMAVGRSCMVVWNGKQAKVYKSDVHLLKFDCVGSIKTAGVAMVIADASNIVDEAWFIAEHNVVKVNNFSGTQKGIINFSEVEGLPEHLDINGRYLAIVTNKGYIKLFDVHTPTKPKQMGSSGQFFGTNSMNSNTCSIRQIKVNCSGTRVAILTDQVEGILQIRHPDSRVHIFDRNKGAVTTFNFAPLQRFPSTVFWDDCDDRLMSCEAVKSRIAAETDETTGGKKGISVKAKTAEGASPSAAATKGGDMEKSEEVEVYIFFATSDHGILMQDSLPRKQPFGAMMGMEVPRLYFRGAAGRTEESSERVDSAAPTGSKTIKVYSKVMRDFVGMDDNSINETTKIAMLNFSYNLTLGKLDEAYRAVKAINSPAIWENMAHMCVKTKRLDVAEVCLANMGHVRGAAAVREARKDESNSLEVSVGVLAMQLGLLDDAARLFREANRFDMLNKLYQAGGLWDKAIATAFSTDRIHLKTTHYQFAKHLESIGRIDDAIEHFQLSENARTEVPRMLFHLGRVDELEEYVLKSEDPALLKWWAAYLESMERFDKAKKFYNKAKDCLSLVRISCFKGDFTKAAVIVSETGDRASAYHFARQLENQGDFHEAINFYASSGCYNHSIRLAMIHSIDSELMRYALKSTPSLMIECAVHFEEKGEYDKAVQLYHKGGDIPRALDLCFRAAADASAQDKDRNGRSNSSAQQSVLLFDMLNTIAQDLSNGDEGSSPQTLARCAEFLVQHKQYDKAIELYVKAKRYKSAVEMCVLHKVNINEDMMERLTPPQDSPDMDSNERKEILLDLAKVLKKQGLYNLAYKKYTEAGDRLHAIKCLVRAGNTKAVIKFATLTNAAKNPEIYITAANYLQSMNWQESVEILKYIVSFYTKAKAFIQLSNFYDSCAQVEIDEYRDYEKAIGALRQAIKSLRQADSPQAENMAESIERRISNMEKFNQAKQVLTRKEPTANTMVALCEQMLRDPHIEESVRSGDVLAALVDYFHSVGQMEEASKYLRDMEDRQIQPHSYIEPDVINQVYKSAPQSKAGSRPNKHFDEEEVEDSMGGRQSPEEDRRGRGSRPNITATVTSNIMRLDNDDDDDEIIDEVMDDDDEPSHHNKSGAANKNNPYGSSKTNASKGSSRYGNSSGRK